MATLVGRDLLPCGRMWLPCRKGLAGLPEVCSPGMGPGKHLLYEVSQERNLFQGTISRAANTLYFAILPAPQNGFSTIYALKVSTKGHKRTFCRQCAGHCVAYNLDKERYEPFFFSFFTPTKAVMN